MAFMTDAAALLGASANQTVELKNSTSEKAGASLDTTDFLVLMCAMFQNQDIDNTASTTDMMNQMVQISVIQAISDISTLINDTSTLTYASSLVGKTVTIGDLSTGTLREIIGTVTGTGQLNGEQVIFVGDDVYKLSDVMAVGKLPEIKDPGNTTPTPPTTDTTTPPTTDTENTDTTNPPENTETTNPPTDTDSADNDNPNQNNTPDGTNNGAAQANPEVRMA